MSDGVKETACTRCIHREVYIYKQDFLDICNAVFATSVYRACDDEKTASIKKVTNFECLEDIVITCRFHRPEQANIGDGLL